MKLDFKSPKLIRASAIGRKVLASGLGLKLGLEGNRAHVRRQLLGSVKVLLLVCGLHVQNSWISRWSAQTAGKP